MRFLFILMFHYQHSATADAVVQALACHPDPFTVSWLKDNPGGPYGPQSRVQPLALLVNPVNLHLEGREA